MLLEQPLCSKFNSLLRHVGVQREENTVDMAVVYDANNKLDGSYFYFQVGAVA